MVPQRQSKVGHLWFKDGSCERLRPLYTSHVRSYAFVAEGVTDKFDEEIARAWGATLSKTFNIRSL